MKGTRDSDDGAIKCPLTQMRSCEERLGALVIEMLHAKQTRIATETDAATEAQLNALMALIFTKGQK